MSPDQSDDQPAEPNDRYLPVRQSWVQSLQSLDFGRLVLKAVEEEARFAEAAQDAGPDTLDPFLAGLQIPEGGAEIALLGERGVSSRTEEVPLGTMYESLPMQSWRERNPDVPETMLKDWEQFQDLRDADFTGARFDLFIEELWQYGRRTFTSWMRKDVLVQKAADKKIAIGASMGERDLWVRSAAVREDLACNAVAEGMMLFTGLALREGSWSPHGKASLRTYFIGACLRAFRTVFKAWSRQRRHHLRAQAAMVNMAQVQFSAGPAESAIRRDTLVRVLDGATPEARAICALILSTGGTYAEIGRTLGMTTRAVEGHMFRLRQRAEALERRALPPGTGDTTAAVPVSDAGGVR